VTAFLRVLIGIAAVSCLQSPSYSADFPSLRGPWIGTQENYPLKLALIVEYFQPESGIFQGDARFGYTGYKSANLSLAIVKIEGKTDGGGMWLVGKASFAEMLLNLKEETLEGSIRYLRTGAERNVIFRRVSAEAELQQPGFNAISVGKNSEILVSYLSTPDCTYCRRWEGTYRDKFLSTETARAIRFVEVKGANLPSGIQQADWPTKEQDIVQQLAPGRLGVPSFVLAVDRKVIFHLYGLDNWEYRFEPLVKQYVVWRRAAAQ
jgi:hypothetical protein